MWCADTETVILAKVLLRCSAAVCRRWESTRRGYVRGVLVTTLDVRDQELRSLLRTTPNLLRLDVSYCSRLTDAVLMELATLCPRLRRLEVSECAFTGEALLHATLECRDLGAVNARYCPKIQGETLHCVHAVAGSRDTGGDGPGRTTAALLRLGPTDSQDAASWTSDSDSDDAGGGVERAFVPF